VPTKIRKLKDSMLKALVISTLFIGSLAGASYAADPQPRLVTVTGEGEVMVAPDEAIMNLQVQSFDAELAKAVSANDAAVGNVLAVVKKYGVEESDFRTDYFNVSKQENQVFEPLTNQYRPASGYHVVKNIAITLRDLGKLEALYSDVLAAGVNNVHGVEFRTSQVKVRQEEARLEAINDAKNKAARLASALGQELGRPHNIQENAPVEWNGPVMMMASRAEAAYSKPTIALGQIPVKSSVSVSFELK
jgi:uncharacterized protein